LTIHWPLPIPAPPPELAPPPEPAPEVPFGALVAPDAELTARAFADWPIPTGTGLSSLRRIASSAVRLESHAAAP
jgi:hypothetical protein